MSRQARAANPIAEQDHQLTVYDDAAADAGESLAKARPIPRISIQAFCENGGTADALQVAAEDRRLAKAHVSVHMGGATAAVAHYQQSPTPNLIVIESSLPRQQMLAELDRLAESCDRGTKVVVIGHVNDVILYRELLKRGVSEYLVAPVTPLQLMESVSNLYNNPESDPVGHVFAFIGAKGGVGSSTAVPQRRLDAVGGPADRASSSPISTSRSGPPGSISTRIRCRASPKRCRARSASTRCCSIVC